MKFRLSPATERFLAQYKVATPQGLLLTGPAGIGLYSLAELLARTNGTVLAVVRPDTKTATLPSISVEQIRELYTVTRSRLDGLHFVIIDDADAMNHVAQNALLKLLEEPNESIRFILTSHTPDKLLPTIRSRTQSFVVPKISTIESKRLLATTKDIDDVTIQRLLFVADGLPALLHRLANGEADFKKVSERVQSAREIIQGTPYQRLAYVSSFSGDRHEAIAVLEMVILLLRRSLAAQPNRTSVEFIEKLLDSIAIIRANGNVKLQLATAMV